MVWGTESWVLSGVPGNESIVAEGPEKGKRITDLYPGQFPLLIKFIDAKKDLSIQVHPNDELAARRHNCKGKTEMWYVIGTSGDAHLLSGLKKKIDSEEYVRLVEEDKIVDVLADYPVSEGDVFFLPAGRIHAIGGGCRIAEIQQTSDITYRIYDYGRPGLDGKPRQLHTQEAKDAIDYTVYPDYRTSYERRTDENVEVVSCPLFTTSVLDLTKAFSFATGGCGDFVILICCHGSAVVKSESGECLSISEGGAILVPAGDGNLEIVPDGKACLLTTHV
ncbi:MAG: mannose-6-phosphate isomerase [Bacteroidales bacterium]|nr:mannose-6-phosphate isomerase [Bacteroidales bacterium]